MLFIVLKNVKHFSKIQSHIAAAVAENLLKLTQGPLAFELIKS
jgi:hypothetical protein